MSVLDRLEDGFPHGELEGARLGCTGAICPATPMTCEQVASAYRSNLRARRAYDTGVRGAELLALLEVTAPPARTVREKKRAGEYGRPQPTGPAYVDLSRKEQDAAMLRFRAEGVTFRAIAAWAGMSHASVEWRIDRRRKLDTAAAGGAS